MIAPGLLHVHLGKALHTERVRPSDRRRDCPKCGGRTYRVREVRQCSRCLWRAAAGPA